MTYTFSSARRTARTSLVLAAAAAGLAIAGCATEPKPVAPLVVPPQAPPPPPVTLSNHVVEAASEYRAYIQKVTKITPSFQTGPQIEESLAVGEAYEAQQLSRGVIAYGAVVALQDPTFVAGVRTFAVDPDGRKAMAAKIIADPNYVAALPGAPNAAGLVIATLGADASKVRGAGELVKQFAYDVQHQAWSKKTITDPLGRLARAKSASNAAMTPAPEDMAALQSAATGSSSGSGIAPKALLVSGTAVPGPYTPVVARALAIAALAALGEGGDDEAPQLDALMTETTGGFCLNMSKLNLYQCLAVAKPWYEDVFCLGQHVLIDTGQCISKEVGAAPAGQVASTPETSGKAPAPGAQR